MNAISIASDLRIATDELAISVAEPGDKGSLLGPHHMEEDGATAKEWLTYRPVNEGNDRAYSWTNLCFPPAHRRKGRA